MTPFIFFEYLAGFAAGALLIGVACLVVLAIYALLRAPKR